MTFSLKNKQTKPYKKKKNQKLNQPQDTSGGDGEKGWK